jgi:hypothetical protein
MMTDQEEIATLRAQITEAEGRIAVLEAKQSRKSGTVPIEEERGVTISEVQAVVACALSDEKQLRQLADIVLEQFPQLAPSYPHGAPAWQRDDVERRWREFFRSIHGPGRDAPPGSAGSPPLRPPLPRSRTKLA